MFDTIFAFVKDAVSTGKFDVEAFLAIINDALAAIFGFIKKEEEIA